MEVRFPLLAYNPYSKPEWEHLDEFIWAVCIVAGVVALVVVVWKLFGRSAADDRQDALESLAVQLGLKYSTQGILDVSKMIDKARSLVKVEFAIGYNVLYGELRGTRLLAFDFGYSEDHEMGDWYRTPIGKIRSSFDFVSSAAAVPFKWTGPGVIIKTKWALSQVLSELTDDRLDFASPAFNKEYSVECGDEDFLKSLLNEEISDYLVKNPGWTVELCSGGVVVSGKGEWTIDEFRGALDFLTGLFERLPAAAGEEIKSGE